MAHTCSKCSRVNPASAVYCYHDGFALGNGSGGPAVAGGQRNFGNPFVFPSGRACRNFDELAMACQECWNEACGLLDQGYLESFLGGMGRIDLAQAAKEAARYPDRQRGLDQLLNKIPSDVLEEPKLHVEPLELNLGTLPFGTDRSFDLNLENQGMRLIFGTVTSEDCAWLAFGDEGHEKTFELTHDATIPVKVRGDRLRAGNKPLEGRLLIESNAGIFTIIVRALVPVKPFPNDVLAGATAPRQIAEKARANPKAAALLFEQGAVAKWYKDNGWVYPVQAPSSSGLAAVQQFFEALGLTPPPKVDVNKRSIRLQGSVGDTLRESIEVATTEKRPVWAHATSDSPWIEVGRPKLNGRTATIGLGIPSVPNRPGQIITAKITVTSNGNQRFVVPVTLTIGEGFAFGPPAATPAPAVAAPAAASPIAALGMATPVVFAEPSNDFIPPPAMASPSYQRYQQSGGFGWLLHILPALILALIVLGIVIVDFSKNRSERQDSKITMDGSDSNSSGQGNSGSDGFPPVDPDPIIGINYSEETHRFGIVMLKEKSEDPTHKYKRLTYDEQGGQNNTYVKYNGAAYLLGKDNKQMKKLKHTKGVFDTWTVEMVHPDPKVIITQKVMLVPGDTGVLDTCLVQYTIENKENINVSIGVRIMIDTFIGSNDGVPFSIPGRKPPMVDDLAILEKGDIPDYIQALEKPDLADPGTIAHIGLKGFHLPGVDRLEEPAKVVLCRWPKDEGGRDAFWDWAWQPINFDPAKPDSCLVIFWPYRETIPGEKREMAFTYGLSGISKLADQAGSGEKGRTQVGVFASRGVQVNEEFTVTGYVKNPKPGVPLKLIVPNGLEVVGNAEQMPTSEGEGKMTEVSWKVKATSTGDYDLEVAHGEQKVKRAIKVVKKKSIFD